MTRKKSGLIRYTLGETALGLALVAASELGVCAIFLGDDAEALVLELNRRFPESEPSEDGSLGETLAQVASFIEDPSREFPLPLDLQGSTFQTAVWEALRQIPSGSTVSYTELAHRIGRPQSVRAVAGACAANTLAVVVPCHRVLRSDGSLSGYRWGVERKRELLRRERESVSWTQLSLL
jgi:AraC family transcriptional regulator of adaptative response/methylated-DNA-[protein]-cysteine methyltransferase